MASSAVGVGVSRVNRGLIRSDFMRLAKREGWLSKSRHYWSSLPSSAFVLHRHLGTLAGSAELEGGPNVATAASDLDELSSRLGGMQLAADSVASPDLLQTVNRRRQQRQEQQPGATRRRKLVLYDSDASEAEETTEQAEDEPTTAPQPPQSAGFSVPGGMSVSPPRFSRLSPSPARLAGQPREARNTAPSAAELDFLSAGWDEPDSELELGLPQRTEGESDAQDMNDYNELGVAVDLDYETRRRMEGDNLSLGDFDMANLVTPEPCVSRVADGPDAETEDDFEEEESVTAQDSSVDWVHPDVAVVDVGATGRSLALKRHELSQHYFQQFNRLVFGDQLPADMEINWTGRLRTSAGICHMRQVKETKKIFCAISLSTSVIQSEAALRATLLHELCHAAVAIIDGDINTHHGPPFKRWAKACKELVGVPVSTYHKYELQYKYRWACVSCYREYGRTVNSIDPGRHRCGNCGGFLRTLEKANKRPSKPATGFAKFVKEQYALVRAETAGDHSATMKALSQRYQAVKLEQGMQQQQQQ